MKYILLLLVTLDCFALEAVVKVLETPMLKEKSFDAPVVQYLRKGDVIKIDPSLANDAKYDRLAPPPEKLKAIRERLSRSPEWNDDPMFKGTTPVGNDNDEFIATLDRQGHTVYVIRDHLYIYYDDKRELTQSTSRFDETDYRLEEPLPKSYPLFSPSGYRGQILLGLMQPYYESYPYDATVKTKGYHSPIDFNATALRKKPTDTDDRFFTGLTLNIRHFSNYYSLSNGRESDETGMKIGIGPYLSYDAFKGEKNRVNIFGSLNLYLFNQMVIKQHDRTTEATEERDYRSYTAVPRVGLQYHRKDVLEDIDFVLGTSLEVEPPTRWSTTSAPKNPSWWHTRGNDYYSTNATFSLAAFLGVQSAY